MNSNTAKQICERTYNQFQYFCVCIQYIWLLCYLFRMIFFHNLFCFINFPREFAVFQSLVTRFICNFEWKSIVLLFYLVSFRILYITFRVETSAHPEIFQGRGGFMKLGHFDKHFFKKSRKKAPQGNISEFFLLDTLKITF